MTSRAGIRLSNGESSAEPLGERPPFLPDFLNDEVSVEVAVPSSRKLVFITVRELLQAS
jgi:hypothetical protein